MSDCFDQQLIVLYNKAYDTHGNLNVVTPFTICPLKMKYCWSCFYLVFTRLSKTTTSSRIGNVWYHMTNMLYAVNGGLSFAKWDDDILAYARFAECFTCSYNPTLEIHRNTYPIKKNIYSILFPTILYVRRLEKKTISVQRDTNNYLHVFYERLHKVLCSVLIIYFKIRSKCETGKFANSYVNNV